MTQATTFSVPTTGPASPDIMATRIDDNFLAALSGHSGSSRPTYAVAGTVWEDTAVAGQTKFYLYDGTDDILLYTVDTSNNRIALAPQPYVDLAGAATTDIGAITSGNVRVTGSGATITSLGTAAAGTVRDVLFSGAQTLTHNATSLILQNGGSNISTAAGDTMRFVSLGSGNWRQTDWQQATPSFFVDFGAKTATGSETALSWVDARLAQMRMLIVTFVGFSTNGTSNPIVQLGDSGGYENAGYSGSASNITGSGVTTSTDNSGFRTQNSVVAGTTFHGTMTLVRVTGDTWAVSGLVGSSDTTATGTAGASKTLSSTITQIQVTTEGGANTIDSGVVVNVLGMR